MTILALDNLSAGYGRHPQLRDITLSVPAGQSLAIIGVNGAGKTTLLKCLLGLHRPWQGTVRIMGSDPGKTETRQHFAFLPERFAPSPLLTGLEVMRLTRLGYGLADNRAVAIGVAAKLGLASDLLRARIRTYSKGTTQKLGLAAALYTERQLLILDEPFSGLDPVARLALLDVLQDFKASGGTLIFTSHLLTGLAGLCDQVAMLAVGRLAFTGTPAAFAALHPKNDSELAFLALAKAAS